MTLNARGRMATVTRAGQAVAEYGYDIHQLRVSKTLGDGTIIHYHYDDQGRMISETDGITGAIIREYIWFGLSPVAVIDGIDLNYIHTDHLGRPTFVTDPSGNSIWDGGITTPFGVSLNTVGAFTQNLMFPGQYRDEETGYDQNWNRTYDPELGRYLQSDPIGLAGGLNRYAYVGGNPVGWVDPRGLDFIQSEENGYVPDGLNFNANVSAAERLARESSGLKGECVKYLVFYRLVKYGGPWDFKQVDQKNRKFDRKNGYSPDFENFGNWHYGVVGAAMGFSESVLLNAAGAAQIKAGNGKFDYMNEELGCPQGTRICAINSSPRHWDDPNDQYWIKKGIDDYNNGKLLIGIRGRGYKSYSREGLR